MDLKNQDNLYEVERIDNEVISKYEYISSAGWKLQF